MFSCLRAVGAQALILAEAEQETAKALQAAGKTEPFGYLNKLQSWSA